MLKYAMIVGAGGFLGSALRFLISRWTIIHFESSFPLGTLIVNILGSLLLGIILGLSEKSTLLHAEVTLLLTVGFCGGFTTFSTFSLEGLQLIEAKQWLNFLTYAGLSFSLGLFSVFAGRWFIFKMM